MNDWLYTPIGFLFIFSAGCLFMCVLAFMLEILERIGFPKWIEKVFDWGDMLK